MTISARAEPTARKPNSTTPPSENALRIIITSIEGEGRLVLRERPPRSLRCEFPSEQLADRFALHNVMRSAQHIGDAGIGAISECMVDSGDEVGDVDWVVGRHGALRVAAAHQLPATHAAA